MMSNVPAPLSTFISYSHGDEVFKDDLVVHLAPLKRQGKIQEWQDRDIEAGAEWGAEIQKHLESAEIILLLITPRFLASNYCYDLEMQRALQHHDEGTACVIPIIVKPCDWEATPFGKLQVLPKDAKPITQWDDPDVAFLNVIKGIRRTVESLQAKKHSGPIPPIPTPPSTPVASPSLSNTSGSRHVDLPVTKPKSVPQVPSLAQPVDRVERLTRPAQLPKPLVSTVEFEVATISCIEKGAWGLGAPQVKTLRRRATAECRRESLRQGVDLDLVMVPGGTFQMGSAAGQAYDSERPQHTVAVKPFLMGRYLVTQLQWRVVAELPKIARDLDADLSRFKGNSLPVERVIWDDAMEFCQRLSEHTKREYRLPSEAEWEYACRAGTTTPFHFGDTLTSELANYRATVAYGGGPKGTYREKTTDVGSFPANVFGLYDMHGNVWEWCQDHWHENYAGAPTDGSAWLSSDENEKRLLRGGSWDLNPGLCRSASRFKNARTNRDYVIGFRVVCVFS